MADDKLERDEQYQHLLDLREKSSQLSEVIQQGSDAEDFKAKHPFWPTFLSTLTALRDSYHADTFKAARDNRAEISNFLGREEGIADVLRIIDEFSQKAAQAQTEKSLADEEISQITRILASPEATTLDNGGAMG